MENVIRIVDNKEKIFIVDNKHQRITLFEDEDYPKDGILGLTKIAMEKRYAEVLKEIEDFKKLKADQRKAAEELKEEEE